MTWLNAIITVLKEEGNALHYSDITEKIIEKGYKNKDEITATPSASVSWYLSDDVKNNGNNSKFIKVDKGTYYLKNPNTAVVQAISTEKDEKEEIKIIQEERLEQNKSLILTSGFYWARNDVQWKNNPSLWGKEQREAVPIDFASQIGIYLLHDGREVIYAGQAIKQPIAERLYDHTTDRHAGRWDRFSWFGFKSVTSEGKLNDNLESYTLTIQQIADIFEMLLIECLEPRQNRKRGNKVDYEISEYIQFLDPNIQKNREIEVANKMINRTFGN